VKSDKTKFPSGEPYLMFNLYSSRILVAKVRAGAQKLTSGNAALRWDKCIFMASGA
jgi:hypothetical protein